MEAEVLQKFQKRIEGFNIIIRELNELKEASKKFDGKMYNKKMRLALDVAAKSIYPHSAVIERFKDNWNGPDYIYFELILSGYEQYYNGTEIGHWANSKRYIVYPDKRFNHEEFCKEVDERIKYFEGTKAEHEKSIEVFDDVAAKFKEFSDAWKKFAESVPSPIRPYVRSNERTYFGFFGL